MYYIPVIKICVYTVLDFYRFKKRQNQMSGNKQYIFFIRYYFYF